MSRKRKSRIPQIAAESLEPRVLLSASASLTNGTLTINADSGGSEVEVTDSIPSYQFAPLIVTAESGDGTLAFAVPKSAVNEIRFYGSDSSDSFANNTGITSRLYGYGGADDLSGGWNIDRNYGSNGDDVLRGKGSTDYLFGGAGDDVLLGGAGVDYLHGHADNDHLFGGDGNDYLYGGSGRDGLAGGWGIDTQYGGPGADRYLRLMDDDDFDYEEMTDEDVGVNFGDADQVVMNFPKGTTLFQAGKWSEVDILQIDIGLDLMASRTGNNVLLQDVDGSELDFYRHGSATTFFSPSGTQYTAYNSGGDMYFSDSVFTSEDNVVRIVAHEVAHNWDSASEVEERLGYSQAYAIITTGFRAESGWAQGTFFADNIPGYIASDDGNWSYQSSAQFARGYGQTNPAEDFATAFAAYFMDLDGRSYPGPAHQPFRERSSISKPCWMS